MNGSASQPDAAGRSTVRERIDAIGQILATCHDMVMAIEGVFNGNPTPAAPPTGGPPIHMPEGLDAKIENIGNALMSLQERLYALGQRL